MRPIFYVTRTSRWFPEGGFNLLAIRDYGKHKVIAVPPDETPKIRDSIIFFENVQQVNMVSPYYKYYLYRLLRGVFPSRIVQKLKDNGNIVVGGVAGPVGFRQFAPLLLQFHMLRCNIDPVLQEKVKAIHPNVHVIPTGEDPELFRPTEKPDEIIISWAGRDHKRFKRADLLEQLGYPYKKASYFGNFVPHEKMPEFLNSSSVHVVTSESEGFGRMILEAALCGLPVISSDVGVARHILDDEWIVPEITAAEYRKRIVPAFEDRESIGRSNRGRALKFTWEYVAGLYDKMWEAADTLG